MRTSTDKTCQIPRDLSKGRDANNEGWKKDTCVPIYAQLWLCEWGNGDERIQSLELDSIPGLTKKGLYLQWRACVTRIFSWARLPFKLAASSHVYFLVVKMVFQRLKRRNFPRWQVESCYDGGAGGSI